MRRGMSACFSRCSVAVHFGGVISPISRHPTTAAVQSDQQVDQPTIYTVFAEPAGQVIIASIGDGLPSHDTIYVNLTKSIS